jgi:hypothetical protein
MLPIRNDIILMEHSIKALQLGGADLILIITSIEKIALHARYFGAGLDFRVKYSDDLWKTLQMIFEYQADEILYAMPDTYFPEDIFTRNSMKELDLNFGCFKTPTPSRFGVILNDKIYDKQSLPEGSYTAWGVISWTRTISEYWRNGNFTSQPEALSKAMKEFGYSITLMEYYYDMANWESYLSFIRRSVL